MSATVLNNSVSKAKLPKGWEVRPIESLCKRVTSGGTPSRKEPSYYENGSILWIKSSELKDWYVHDTSEKITSEGLQSSSAKLLPANTILLALYGDGKTITSLGILAKESTCNQACCAMICDPEKSDHLFVFYSLKYHRPELIGLASGASQRNLSGKILREFPIATPPLNIQRKIASILSAYDDLIENNTRRIATLEEMAQAVYREWFVEFRFPGHEQVMVVDSPMGRIPEGWEITQLRRITTKIGSGATPRGGKEAYKAKGITLIRSLNVYDYHFELDGLAFIDDEQAALLDNVAVERGDVLLNITGASVARCCMVPSYLLPARVNQHVAIIRVSAESADPYYVLDTINNERHKRHILALAQGGATREALTKDTISNYEIVLPPLKILKGYSEIVAALYDQREVLQRKNNCLRTTRDLLLPKLISGQLDVEDLDIDTGQPHEEVKE